MNARTSLRLEDSDTEIVVVSDTVRQRRARTPQANESNSDSNGNVLPDLLPQTFRLSESSNLFSQVSEKRNENPSVVEVKERNLSQSPLMSVALPKVAEIVDTVETVGHFVPEFVETVQVLDMSEDSDSSNRLDEDYVELREDGGPLKEDDPEDGVILRDPTSREDSKPVLKVEKQRISFEEKRKRIDKERDILRDSEEDLEIKSIPKKPKRLRQLFLDEEQKDYDPDETLVFSEDEDIPRFSLENSLAFESDSDTVVDFFRIFYRTKESFISFSFQSRIETPVSKKRENLLNKLSPSGDNSNLTLTSPTPRYEYKGSSSLEQRVFEFDKTAKYMIRKLESTKEKIENSDGERSGFSV